MLIRCKSHCSSIFVTEMSFMVSSTAWPITIAQHNFWWSNCDDVHNMHYTLYGWSSHVTTSLPCISCDLCHNFHFMFSSKAALCKTYLLRTQTYHLDTLRNYILLSLKRAHILINPEKINYQLSQYLIFIILV